MSEVQCEGWSESSHTMISVADYQKHLFNIDAQWSKKFRPYGIHFCGRDPHRFAQSFTELPALNFLDVGWGGDVALLRRHLADTFLNIWPSPVEIIDQSPDQIEEAIRGLVADSGDLALTGVCCINMDEKVSDEKITAILKTVESLRREYCRN